jgi:hypothetical protein
MTASQSTVRSRAGSLYLFALTVAASTVPSLCLTPATPMVSPILSSPQLFPENVVALLVRT